MVKPNSQRPAKHNQSTVATRRAPWHPGNDVVWTTLTGKDSSPSSARGCGAQGCSRWVHFFCDLRSAVVWGRWPSYGHSLCWGCFSLLGVVTRLGPGGYQTRKMDRWLLSSWTCKRTTTRRWAIACASSASLFYGIIWQMSWHKAPWVIEILWCSESNAKGRHTEENWRIDLVEYKKKMWAEIVVHQCSGKIWQGFFAICEVSEVFALHWTCAKYTGGAWYTAGRFARRVWILAGFLNWPAWCNLRPDHTRPFGLFLGLANETTETHQIE